MFVILFVAFINAAGVPEINAIDMSESRLVECQIEAYEIQKEEGVVRAWCVVQREI